MKLFIELCCCFFFFFISLVQRELVKIRYRWTEADVAGDNELDTDEFLAFRHPEIAGHSFKQIVDELILQMGLLFINSTYFLFDTFKFSDRNNDQQLNESEFAFLPCKSYVLLIDNIHQCLL